MADSSPDSKSPLNPDALRAAIVSGDPVQAMPALAGLRSVESEVAIPLLLLGLEQEPFIVRSLSCAGLGVKRSAAGWEALQRALRHDDDANVRAEAANALASYGAEQAWPLLREAFAADNQWLVRCSILSALAEQAVMGFEPLLELARMAIADADSTVRVGGAEILGRLAHEEAPAEGAEAVRELLRGLQHDPDHRVVAAALNGLQR
ncbi:HEAT repeat domain-containing protein [Synechococcus sp. ATX 2A4]|uniref:HEAT repeat domain-containing protein n=1 Tax=Synechococcus sp. ATX 2A4 TaxID=2823727 RepID=UPI0020CC14DF|nr:HEAT repeat domain-containing protein [Synechococcus sp. ATX 2A4]MCP9885685.1 HEAT repeat domain-containing protein [Synechococcus sp. ATX 2A4]